MVRGIVIVTLALSALLTGPAAAQEAGPATVAVVVSVPTPAGLSHEAVEQAMQKTVPTYRAVPGLLRKYFTIGPSDFGGVYLFETRAKAQAWFNEAWDKRILATYGAPAKVTYYDVPIVLDNGSIPRASQPR